MSNKPMPVTIKISFSMMKIQHVFNEIDVMLVISPSQRPQKRPC